MEIIKYTTSERDLFARLMRAEAVGEDELGMLMVGNVGVNRTLADCYTFVDIRTIYDMIYQDPGGFLGSESPLFFSAPTTAEKNLADRVLKANTIFPLLTRYGSMLLELEIVALKHGGNKILPVNIRIIAFINQMSVFANQYIKRLLT